MELGFADGLSSDNNYVLSLAPAALRRPHEMMRPCEMDDKRNWALLTDSLTRKLSLIIAAGRVAYAAGNDEVGRPFFLQG